MGIFLRVCVVIFSLWRAEAGADTRPAAVAGQFYPKEEKNLAKKIQSLLANVVPSPSQGILKALIVPHAGYDYSGDVAAHAYQQVAHLKPKRIIILGPSHRVNIQNQVVMPQSDSWQTPLGKVEIDQVLRQKLKAEASWIVINDKPHTKEHALEVQLPFIQTLFPGVPILPMVVNQLDQAEPLAAILANYLEDTLLIVSTDLSHHHPAKVAETMDGQLVQTLLANDLETFVRYISQGKVEACGAAGVATLIALAKVMGAAEMKLIKYDHSGQQTGDHKSVVGYLGAVVSRPHLYQNLLDYAYQVLAHHLDFDAEKPVLQDEANPFYTKLSGAFVTLRSRPNPGEREGKLRGCIGQITPKLPLKEAIRQLTIDSATKDSRFPPVQSDELGQIQIELSLLTPAKQVSSEDDIIFGKHGVILSQGNKQGIFLPEVAESFTNKEAFLRELCAQKAGLPRQCYQDPQTKIQVFETLHYR
jgi:MEMO1 family protein